MDQELMKRFETEEAVRNVQISVANAAAGEILLIRGEEKEVYTLKPLNDLYGLDNSGSVDPKNETFMPLFLCIEESIARFDAKHRRLNNTDVALALRHLSINPEELGTDALIQGIQGDLRLNLSLNNYSRQELRQVIRKIGKSVDRHTDGGRGRGYLNYIHEFFGKLRK